MSEPTRTTDGSAAHQPPVDVRSLAYRVGLAIDTVHRFAFAGEPGCQLREWLVAAEVAAAGGSLTAADLAAVRRGERDELPAEELAILAAVCGVPAAALVDQPPPGTRLVLIDLADATHMGYVDGTGAPGEFTAEQLDQARALLAEVSPGAVVAPGAVAARPAGARTTRRWWRRIAERLR